MARYNATLILDIEAPTYAQALIIVNDARNELKKNKPNQFAVHARQPTLIESVYDRLERFFFQ